MVAERERKAERQGREKRNKCGREFFPAIYVLLLHKTIVIFKAVGGGSGVKF